MGSAAGSSSSSSSSSVATRGRAARTHARERELDVGEELTARTNARPIRGRKRPREAQGAEFLFYDNTLFPLELPIPPRSFLSGSLSLGLSCCPVVTTPHSPPRKANRRGWIMSEYLSGMSRFVRSARFRGILNLFVVYLSAEYGGECNRKTTCPTCCGSLVS